MKKTRIDLGVLLYDKSHSCSGFLGTDLYSEAKRSKEKKLTFLLASTPDDQLAYIAYKISECNMVVQQEIFFIGEMLVQARQILRENKKSFRLWIKENCDFGYDTARNFINVFTACLGQLELIINVKPSVLYRISSQSFPKELRDFLIFSNEINRLDNKELRALYREYQAKGFEAVRAKFEEKMEVPVLKQQIIPFVDNLTKTIYVVRKQRSDLLHKLKGFDASKRKGATEAGDEIISIIAQTMQQCLKVLLQAKIKTDKKIKEIESFVYKGFSEEYSMYCCNYLNPITYTSYPKRFDYEPCIMPPKDTDDLYSVPYVKYVERENIAEWISVPPGIYNRLKRQPDTEK